MGRTETNAESLRGLESVSPGQDGGSGKRPRKVLLLARDRAVEPLHDRLRRDREGAPEAVGRLLTCLDGHLFDEDCALRTLSAGGGDGATAAAADYLGMPLKDYWRAAQVEAFVLLRDTLRRDFGLEAPTGQLAAVVGLRNFSTFRTWYVEVTGKPPEVFVWPKRLRPGTGYPTWNRYARGKLPVEDGRIVLYDLAGIEGPPREIPRLGHPDAIGQAKAETRARIHRDKAHLPEHLYPLLDFIADHLFDGVNATQAKGSIRNKQNASAQLKFYLGETVKSYITKRWVEAAVQAYAESELPIDKISEMLGQSAKRTVYRWVTDHTGENPGDFRRIQPLAEGMVDSETWRRAGYDDPEAARAVIAALQAMGCSAVGVADPGPQKTEGLAARVVEEVRKRPIVVAVVAMEALWQDPLRIEECLRAALDSTFRSRPFSDFIRPDINGSDLAQIACLAARERLWKTGEEDDLVAVAEIAAGVTLLRDLPGNEGVRDALAILRSGLDRLAKTIGAESRALVAELKIGRELVRECLYQSVEMEFSLRKQAVEMAGEAFDCGLLSERTHPDERRWAVASKANLARIATQYREAKALLATVDLKRPFIDISIGGTVYWIAGVIQGETGDWQEAICSLDEAILLIDAADRLADKVKVRISKASILSFCGDKLAFSEFRVCFEKAAGDPNLSFWPMVNLIIAKCDHDLPDDLPFSFEEFVAAADRSVVTKAWIPYCKALIGPKLCDSKVLFLQASREFERTTQVLPAIVATLFAAMESAKAGQISEAYQLGIKAAMSLRTSEAFGGRWAFAAEAFLANLRLGKDLAERIGAFLRRVQMPYRNSDEE